MRISLAQYLRILADKPQTAVSKAIQQFITDVSKTDPHLTKTTADELVTKFKAVVDPLVGHGLSGDSYDEMVKVLESKHTVKEMFRYISNFMLAGAGMAVKEAAAGGVGEYQKQDALKLIEELQDAWDRLHIIRPEIESIERKLMKQYGITEKETAQYSVEH